MRELRIIALLLLPLVCVGIKQKRTFRRVHLRRKSIRKWGQWGFQTILTTKFGSLQGNLCLVCANFWKVFSFEEEDDGGKVGLLINCCNSKTVVLIVGG